MRTAILDDDEAIVQLLSHVCRSEGHEAAAFTSSQDALAYLAAEPVDLLITDMNMPGPDGPVVICEARRLQPGIFTLIITGHASLYPVAELLSDGMADIIFKPFHMNEVKARLTLAERRRQHIARLRGEKQAMQTMSTKMILGLQKELIDVRRGGA